MGVMREETAASDDSAGPGSETGTIFGSTFLGACGSTFGITRG
jgi:hypothetical protein